MKAALHFILPILFLLIIFNPLLQAQKNTKPAYGGRVEFTQGNFGSFDYPIIGDSVIVFLKDSTGIDFIIFPKKDKKNPRHIDLYCDQLQLVNRKEYEDIVAIDKTIPTGNFDLKLMNSSSDYVHYMVYLSHFGNGRSSTLTIIGEYENVRIHQVTVIELVRLK